MSTYVITNDQGDAVSIGTVIADPLPDGLTAHALTEDDAEALSTGDGRWDAATLAVVDVPVEQSTPDPDRYVAAEMAGRAAYDAALVGKSRTGPTVDAAVRAKSDAFLAALENIA